MNKEKFLESNLNILELEGNFGTGSAELEQFMEWDNSYSYNGGLADINTLEDDAPKKKFKDDFSLKMKREFREFLCEDSAKYSGIWKQLEALEDKSTMAIVSLISSGIGSEMGIAAGILSGLISIMLHSFLKIGKEIFCKQLSES